MIKTILQPLAIVLLLAGMLYNAHMLYKYESCKIEANNAVKEQQEQVDQIRAILGNEVADATQAVLDKIKDLVYTNCMETE